MARSTAQAPNQPQRRQAHPDRDAWARTVSLVVIAVVLVLGASTQMAQLIVPCVLALVLAIALRPMAHWLERRGLGRGLSSVLCTLVVALIFLAAAGLVVAQASRVVRNSDHYFDQFSRLASRIAKPLEGSSLLLSMTDPGAMTDEGEGGDPGDGIGEAGAGEAPGRGRGGPSPDTSEESAATDPGTPGDRAASGTSGSADDSGDSGPGGGLAIASQEYWARKVRENAGAIGQWLLRSVGGVLGVLGQVVVFLFLILYILYTREDWSDRIVRAGRAMGMRLDEEDLGKMGRTIGSWVGCVLMVAGGYAVTITLVSWALGLPQWPLWGLMTGFLVLIPYFGALIAGAMLVTVAAITSQALWPPLVMLGVYVLLQTLESYIILPLLYGEAIAIDPLAILVGVLFFGFLWGPLGFVAALPMMVLIRGFVEATPGSDPINALIGEESG